MKRKTKIDAYEAYVQQYNKNVAQIARYDNPITAEKVQGNMMSREVFEGSLKSYRAQWGASNPGRHGESADRIAKWVANRETKDRSYKQAQRIKKAAAELGWDLTTNEIQFGSEKVALFWNDYSVMNGEGLIDTNQIWGS